MSNCLQRAIDLAKQLPPFARVWLDDEDFNQLYEDMAMSAPVRYERSVGFDPFKVMVRSVSFIRKRARGAI
jgi:hypothetical protein